MPKGSHQKLKLYYLSQIMTQMTDDEHFLTMPEIQAELAKYDVSADRKSLYDDMEALRVLGLDVIDQLGSMIIVKANTAFLWNVASKGHDILNPLLLVDSDHVPYKLPGG